MLKLYKNCNALKVANNKNTNQKKSDKPCLTRDVEPLENDMTTYVG